MLSESEREILVKLKSKLREINDTQDFVMGVVYSAENSENWQRVIDFIDRNPEKADYETVLAFSVLVDDMTEKDYDGRLF